MEEKNILTREGLKDLQSELKELIEVKRPEVIEKIKEARAQGDLSENAEFDAAREEQGQIEDRIAEIERIIESSKVVSSSKSSKVRIGSEVTVVDQKGEEATYLIVGTLEADPFQNKISNASPLGSVLMNKEQGQNVEVAVEAKGKTKKFEVQIKKVKN